MLLRTLLLDDLLLRKRISFGSAVSSPPAFANKIRMSVRLTTPTSPPLSLAPSIEFIEAEGPVCVTMGVLGDASATEYGSEEVAWGGYTYWCPEPDGMDDLCDRVGTMVEDCMDGVGGADVAGETGSVIHNLWLLVATSLATTCARVFMGVT